MWQQLKVLLMLNLYRSDEEIVRPRVPLAACLESFYASEEIQDFYSSAINARTTAIKYGQWANISRFLG
jgi:ubiquitin carboxyl-terminal hydrolase 5/13